MSKASSSRRVKKPFFGISVSRTLIARICVLIFTLQGAYILKPYLFSENVESSSSKAVSGLKNLGSDSSTDQNSNEFRHSSNDDSEAQVGENILKEKAKANLLHESKRSRIASRMSDEDSKSISEPTKLVSDGDSKNSTHLHFKDSKHILQFESSGVPKPPNGKTCKQWLEEADAVNYKRNFARNPVIILSSEVKTWTECSVGCKFVNVYHGHADASMSNGGDASMTVLRSMEPKSYYPTNDPKTAHAHGFAIVMTVHLDSDVPVGYFSWAEYDIMRPLSEKKAWPAVAVAFISNCNANNFRLEAVQELQKFVAVDSYGRCHNNRPYQRDKLSTISNYKFSLAFENSCEDDYVTEKFFQSLVAGSVPIVIGPKNIFQFAPSNNSFIYMEKLGDSQSVANLMQSLFDDKERYEKMLEWKKKGPSDEFRALVDMAAVHSSCRLCIHVADKIWNKEEGEGKKEGEEEGAKRNRPCKCREETGSDNRILYHIYVRERGKFHFDSFFLYSDELTLENLKNKIMAFYTESNYKPIWVTERPAILLPKEKNPFPLKIHRIYPAISNQKDALYGNSWFRNSQSLSLFVAKTLCPKLEVIFV